ncbi:hypothetical protein NA56DRAFT_743085 [Hyaloscypha hepaticicola]|uniref:Uncharacterized protein n=1 Tax=Hyaloscypha hepaticicola TaxID=2082293 RepID=A0A2J6QNB7_9HELO|nr:hypothetical protein NA56DRAFT_743085 [Hyaloscypha hepaticicola]
MRLSSRRGLKHGGFENATGWNPSSPVLTPPTPYHTGTRNEASSTVRQRRKLNGAAQGQRGTMRELELSRAAVARETEGQRDNYMSPETRGRITTHDGFAAKVISCPLLSGSSRKRPSSTLLHRTAAHHTSRFRERWTWTLDTGRWMLDAAPGDTPMPSQHVASLIEQWKWKTVQLSIVCCPSSLFPAMPLPPFLARSLLERTVRCVMKERPNVESQCAEHGSICPALYCPDGPSRIEFEPLRMALSKLGLC